MILFNLFLRCKKHLTKFANVVRLMIELDLVWLMKHFLGFLLVWPRRWRIYPRPSLHSRAVCCSTMVVFDLEEWISIWE
jgi:hypothetical protein